MKINPLITSNLKNKNQMAKRIIRQKQNRLYLSDENKKRTVSFSATPLEEGFIRQLVYDNNCRSLSDMLNKLCFDKSFRLKFKDIPEKDLQKIIFA